MIEKIKIKSIDVTSGTSKAGRGYNMVKIETTDGRKMSMYVDKEYDLKLKKLERTQDWTEGTEISVKVEQNGEYLNFDLPSRNDVLEDRVGKLEDIVKKLVANAQKTK